MGGVDWEYLTKGFSSGFNMGMQAGDVRRQRARDAEHDRRYNERVATEDQRYQEQRARQEEQDTWAREEHARVKGVRQGAIDIEERRASGGYDTPLVETATVVQNGNPQQRGVNMGGKGDQPSRVLVRTKKGGEFDGSKYYNDLASFYRRNGDAKTGMEYEVLSREEPHRVFTAQVQKFDQAVKLGDSKSAAKALEDTFNKGFPDGRIATVDFENGIFRAKFYSPDGSPMGEQAMSVAQAKELAMSVADPKSYNEALQASAKRNHEFEIEKFKFFATLAKDNPNEWKPIILNGAEGQGQYIYGYHNTKTNQTHINPNLGGGVGGPAAFKDHTKDINAHLEKSGDVGFGDRVSEGVSLSNQVMNSNKGVDAATAVIVAKSAMLAGDKGVSVVSGKRYVPYNGRLYALDPASPQEIQAAQQVIGSQKETTAPNKATPVAKKEKLTRRQELEAFLASGKQGSGTGFNYMTPEMAKKELASIEAEEETKRISGRAPIVRRLAPDRIPEGTPLYADGGMVGEAKFQKWYGEHATARGLNPNPDDPRHHYDYRAAFEAGAGPGPDGHWPSKFKKEGHPRMVIDGVNTKTGKKAYADGGEVWDRKINKPMNSYQRGVTLQGLSADEWYSLTPKQRREIEKVATQTPRKMADGGPVGGDALRDQAFRDVEMLMQH